MSDEKQENSENKETSTCPPIPLGIEKNSLTSSKNIEKRGEKNG